MRSRRFWNRAVVSTVLSLGLLAAPMSMALKERTEEGFPLTFNEQRRSLGDRIELGSKIELTFEVTNPTEQAHSYFMKASSRRVRVTHKEIEIAPGETQEIEVTVENPVPGPFRHRIGIVVDRTRSALFVEGTVVE
jgi:hypothetical protein